MYTYSTNIRISYGDTDKMGYCYYGNYARFYEIARTELLRSLGLSYRELEEKGVMLPVISMNIQFKKPAFYDELITVAVSIDQLPSARIVFTYEVFNEKKEILNEGETTLVFMDAEKKKPMHVPDFVSDLFKKVL